MQLGRPYSKDEGREVVEGSIRVETRNGQKEEEQDHRPTEWSTIEKMETRKGGLCSTTDETSYLD